MGPQIITQPMGPKLLFKLLEPTRPQERNRVRHGQHPCMDVSNRPTPAMTQKLAVFHPTECPALQCRRSQNAPIVIVAVCNPAGVLQPSKST
jgi:hypothetical protein